VAPDEAYLIVSCLGRPENPDDLDLYISFRNSDGTWTRSLNMGENINTRLGENCPQVSPDGKFLFFNRYNPKTERGKMMWVDSNIINRLRPEGQKQNLKNENQAHLYFFGLFDCRPVDVLSERE
jgi:hypothetical protein